MDNIEKFAVCDPDTAHCQLVGAGEIVIQEEDKFIQAAILFQQLSDSTRLKILWLLMQYEICVHDIARILNMSPPAVSHHLRSLRQLEIINQRRNGKHMFYSLADNEDALFIRHMLEDAFLHNNFGEIEGV